MSTITVVTGKKYRILKDAVNKVWNTISFWTSSTDVEFADGMTAEDKVGDIKGLVSTPQSLNGFVMDATVVSPVYKVLNGTIRPNGVLTLTFTDPLISDTAKIQIYTNVWGYTPEEVIVSGNTLTITFPEPDALTLVKVEVGDFSS